MGVFKLIVIVLFSFYSSVTLSQESTWQWINPYPLPFFSSMQEGVNGEIYLWNDYDELYRYKNGEFFYIATPSPFISFNYETDNFSAYTFIVNDSTWYCYNQSLGNYFTNDGGLSYVQTGSTSNGFHTNLQALDENQLLAIAKGELLSKKILLTDNSGEQWNEIYSSAKLLNPYRSGVDTIFALANDTLIYTFDKGENWHKGAECKSCNSLQLENEKLYISSTSEEIFISANYGMSYELLYQLKHNADLGGAFGGSPKFKLKENIGCAISSQRLFVTEDYGETFQTFDYLLPNNISISDCKIIDNTIVLRSFIGSRTLIEFDLGTKTFMNNFSNGLFNLKNFHVVQDSVYVLTSHSNYGDRRNIHISYDKGYSWETKLLPQNELIELDYRNNYGIDFMENDSCIFVSNDRIFKASFPYDIWTEYNSPSDTSTQVLQFYNDDEGLLVDYFHNIYKTVDKGDSWELVTQLDQEYGYVDMFTSKTNEKSYILQQPSWGVSKSILYEFQQGELQDSIIFFDRREDYHGGITYNDSILYLSFYNNTYEINMATNEFVKLCYLNHGKIVHRDSDTLWVKNEGIINKLDLNCQLFSSDTFAYSRHVSEGFVNPLDLIELYVDDTGEAFGYYPSGYMLKYTNDFREDLLVGNEESLFSGSAEEREIYLYPNPTNGILQLNTTLKNPSILFYSTDGKRIGTYQGDSIILPEEMHGLFLYTILEDGKYVTTGKVVVE